MFPRHYTQKQLNRGEGMLFHPVSGMFLAGLEYRKNDRRFLLWSSVPYPWWTEDVVLATYDQLRDHRNEYLEGDPFPKHWKINPWTGQKL